MPDRTVRRPNKMIGTIPALALGIAAAYDWPRRQVKQGARDSSGPTSPHIPGA